MRQLSDDERSENVKTLYCLYRLISETDDNGEVDGVHLTDLLTAIQDLERVTFPPCFRPDGRKVMALAHTAIERATTEGRA